MNVNKMYAGKEVEGSMLEIHGACLDAAEGVLGAVDLLGDLLKDVDVAVLEEFREVEQYGEEDHHGEARVGFLLNVGNVRIQ